MALPSQIGRFEIIRVIGRGGMGVLYLAYDPHLKRDVAIKVMQQQIDEPEIRERFVREAQAAARLRHSNIVTVFDFGEYEGQPYIELEYIPGETLEETILRRAPMPLPRKVEILRDLCRGLAHAHRASVIHRDVKPANVMVDQEGVVKILDFGIARLAESGTTSKSALIGTLSYMSPEQISGRPVDQRTDIFSVGAVAYELCSYQRAFPGGLDEGIVYRVMHEEPTPLEAVCPDLNKEIIAIVMTALQKDPAARYPDASAMARDLESVHRYLSDVAAARADTVRPTRRSIVPASSPTPGRSPTPRGASREELEARRAERRDHLLADAEAAFAQGDHQRALSSCEEAALLHPDDARVQALLTRVHRELDREQVRAWVAEGRKLLAIGAIERAERLAAQARELEPHSTLVSAFLAELDQVRQQRALHAARERAVEDALHAARARLERGAYQSAIRHIDEALVIDPGHVEAQALKERAQRLVAQSRDAPPEPRSRVEDLVARARASLSRAEARKLLIEALAIDPGHPEARRLLETLRQPHSEPPRAPPRPDPGPGLHVRLVRWVAAALLIVAAGVAAYWMMSRPPLPPPDPPPSEVAALISQARAHIAAGAWEEALGVLATVQEIDPDSAERERLLGELQQDAHDEADRARQEAMTRDAPQQSEELQDAAAAFERAQQTARRGPVAQAVRLYYEAASLFDKVPRSPTAEEQTAKQVTALLASARDRTTEGAWEQALALLAKIEEIDPSNAERRQLLGELQQDAHDEADGARQEAMTRDGSQQSDEFQDAAAAFDRAQQTARRGPVAQAVRQYHEVASLFGKVPRSPTPEERTAKQVAALLTSARNRVTQGAWEEALRLLAKVQDLAPGNVERGRLLNTLQQGARDAATRARQEAATRDRSQQSKEFQAAARALDAATDARVNQSVRAYHQAAALFEKVPHTPSPNELAAQHVARAQKLYDGKGAWQAALTLLRQAEELDPDNADRRKLLARIVSDSGTAAGQARIQAIERGVDDDSREFLQARQMMQEATRLEEARQLEAAVRRYFQARVLFTKARAPANGGSETTEHDAIHEQLKRLVAAFADRDVDAVRAVWPGLDAQDLRKTFRACAEGYSHALANVEIHVADGDTAIVTGVRTVECTPNVGAPSTRAGKVRLTLRKQDGAWQIVKSITL